MQQIYNYPSIFNFAHIFLLFVLATFAGLIIACSTENHLPTSQAKLSALSHEQNIDQNLPTFLPPTPPHTENTLPISPLVNKTPQTHQQPADETPTPKPPSHQICSPLQDHAIKDLPEIVSAPYNPPPPGKEQRHHGVDFSYYHHGERNTILGVVVQSVFNGKVAAAISDSFPYGNFVIIETGYKDIPSALKEHFDIKEDQSLYLLYAHLKDPPLVNLGDTVTACQPIGTVGKSGNAGIPHLHLEARIGPSGTIFKSMAFYQTTTTEEERNNYERWRTGGEFNHFDPMLLFSENN